MGNNLEGVHIFWDNDATLVDSEIIAMPHAVESVFAFLESKGLGSNIPVSSRKKYEVEWAGEQISQMFKTVDGWFDIGLSEDLIAELSADDAKRVIKALESVKVIDGIPEALIEVTQQGAISSVVTSSSLARVVPGLKNNGLMPYFTGDNKESRVWSATETLLAAPKYGRVIPKSATTPEIYLYALETTGAVQAIAIEDSASGACAAAAAGIPVIGTTAASHISPETKVAHGEALIARVSETLGRKAGPNDIEIVHDPREIPSAIARVLGREVPKKGIAID